MSLPYGFSLVFSYKTHSTTSHKETVPSAVIQVKCRVPIWKALEQSLPGSVLPHAPKGVLRPAIWTSWLGGGPYTARIFTPFRARCPTIVIFSIQSPSIAQAFRCQLSFFWKYLVHSFTLQCHKHTSISTRRWNFEFLNIHGKKRLPESRNIFLTKKKKTIFRMLCIWKTSSHLGSLPDNTDCRQGQQKRKFDRILLLEPYASQADIPMHYLLHSAHINKT